MSLIEQEQRPFDFDYSAKTKLAAGASFSLVFRLEATPLSGRHPIHSSVLYKVQA